MRTLAERLKFAIARKGVLQKDLARACGVTDAAVTQWVNGDTENLKFSNLVAAARFLGVSVGWLAGDSSELSLSVPARFGAVWADLELAHRARLFTILNASVDGRLESRVEDNGHRPDRRGG